MAGSLLLEHPYGVRAPMLMGVTWTMAGIAIILTVLRTYTNSTIIRHFCWDYYWAMLALVRSQNHHHHHHQKNRKEKGKKTL